MVKVHDPLDMEQKTTEAMNQGGWYRFESGFQLSLTARWGRNPTIHTINESTRESGDFC